MKDRPQDITPQIRTLYQGIRHRPGLYLGSSGESLTLLRTFINGMRYMGDESTEPLVFIPDGFDAFVAAYYGTTVQANSCYSLILRHEAGENAAFAAFWKLLDAYLESVGHAPIPCNQAEIHLSRSEDACSQIYYPDLDALAKSYMATFNGAPWHDRWSVKTAFDRLADLYKTPGFYGVACWRGGKPAGAVMGRAETYYDGTYFQIFELWVEPEYRGRGYARQLMDELLMILAARHTAKVYLTTMHGHSTEDFYKHFGFRTDENLCIMDLWL